MAHTFWNSSRGVPFLLGELDAHIALPEPKRELRWPLLLGPRHKEMPAVPRTLGRPSFEHGVELGQVGYACNEIDSPGALGRDRYSRPNSGQASVVNDSFSSSDSSRSDRYRRRKSSSLCLLVAPAGDRAAPNGPERQGPRESSNRGQGFGRVWHSQLLHHGSR